MANEEQLALLKRGPFEWNQWRMRNADIRIDLTSADLTKATLNGVNLQGADLMQAKLGLAFLSNASLMEANLTGAYLGSADMSGVKLMKGNLTDANLTKVDLTDANLKNAVLCGADLSHAHLPNAHLEGANLSEAILIHTDLSSAILDEATITNAILWLTQWNDVDFRHINGLETVKHVGPSPIGNDSFYVSHGQIPDSFLLGCGVSDEMIDFVHELAQTTLFSGIFLSYSPKDAAFAGHLYHDLQSNNVRCWQYILDLKVGRRVFLPPSHVIRSHQKLLIILSRDSVQSDWLADEVKAALKYELQEQKSVLVPIMLDDAITQVEYEWAQQLREEHPILDFSGWEHQQYQPMFEQLLHSLHQPPFPE